MVKAGRVPTSGFTNPNSSLNPKQRSVETDGAGGIFSRTVVSDIACAMQMCEGSTNFYRHEKENKCSLMP